MYAQKANCQMSTLSWINWLFVFDMTPTATTKERRGEKNKQSMACILTFGLKVWTFYQYTVDNDFMQFSFSCTITIFMETICIFICLVLCVEPNIYFPYPIFHLKNVVGHLFVCLCVCVQSAIDLLFCMQKWHDTIKWGWHNEKSRSGREC